MLIVGKLGKIEVGKKKAIGKHRPGERRGKEGDRMKK